MKRRAFLSSSLFLGSSLLALDFRVTKSQAWRETELNKAAIELYGKEKFATLQKSSQIELIAPKAMVENSLEIPIQVKSDLKAKSVALFQTANEKSLVAVMSIEKGMKINYGLTIRMEMRGTLFAVVEGEDDRLYYARAYIEVPSMSCMAGG